MTRQTARLAFVEHANPDDPIAVGEREGIQQCRIHDAEQPCRGGNPDCQGDDSHRGEGGLLAQCPQRVSGIAEDVFDPTDASRITGPILDRFDAVGGA